MVTFGALSRPYKLYAQNLGILLASLLKQISTRTSPSDERRIVHRRFSQKGISGSKSRLPVTRHF